MLCFFNHKSLRFLTTIIFFYMSISISDSHLNQGLAATKAFTENSKETSWHLTAQTVTFDNKKALYIARNKVVITGGNTRVEADYVEFSNKTKDVFAKGNVFLMSGEDSISCDEMNVNLATETGTIHKGVIFIEKNNFYINGENIRKTGKFSYSADKGSITACTGEFPDWKITGKNIKITIEGYGFADHAVLWAKEIPAVYTPFLVFPAKTKRQTGFLFPRISTSNRKGFEYEQPLFLAISENTDATIYPDYMSKRGIKLGTEFRYVLDNKTKGSMFFDFLEDDKKDDGTIETKNYSFSNTPQRTNSDRFWFRMKHDHDLSNGFTAKLDIDLAGDQDYLHEFQDGFTGYTAAKEYFDKEFGRSLDEYTDNTRKNSLNINKTWAAYTFNIETLWYDNINARRENIDDTTLQTLPGIQFDAPRQQIYSSNFFYSLDTEFKSFYRKDITATKVKGQRADIYPRFYLPLKFGKVVNFEPSVSLRETIWHTNDFTDINDNSDNLRTRNIYDIGALLSTKLTKIFNTENKFADKIRHELTPELTYTFIPDVMQDDLPYFDSIDNIKEKHLITGSLVNNFTSKKSSINPKGKETYRDFAYIKISQSYDIIKKRDNEPKAFSDITIDAELNPHDFFSLDMDLTWSPYDNLFKTLNIANTIKDNRGDTLKAEYRYAIDKSESVYSKIDINLTGELTTYASVEKNLKDNEIIEKKTGFILEKSCWSLDLQYTEAPDDQSIAFLITLHGIGGFGTK